MRQKKRQKKCQDDLFESVRYCPARVGLSELGGDEGYGRVLTIDPPGAAGFHQQPTTLSLGRSRDAARRPLNGRIHICCWLDIALLPFVSIRVHLWLLSSLIHPLNIQRQDRVAIQLEVLDADGDFARRGHLEFVRVFLRTMPGPIVDDQLLVEPDSDAIV